MPGFRDSKSPHGTWLRTLVVLGLVVAVVAETPLRSGGVIPPWLPLDSTGTVAGSVLLPGAPDQAEVAAAAKRKGDKQDRQDKRADKSDQKAEKSGKRHGGKSKHPGEDQDRNPGGGNGKHQGDGKRDTPQRDNDQGNKQITQERKGKDTTSPERRGAADVAAAEVTAAATSWSFTPVADAQVNEANPNTNYGTGAQLRVDGGTDPDVFSYLRFSVSGVSGTVQSATLRLWVQPDGGTQDGPFVKTAGTGWSETGIVWNNRPRAGRKVLDDKGALTGGAWVEYDVTSAVKGNGAVGFTLRPETSDGANFDSREAANKPQLVLTLGGDTPTPTPGPNPTPTPVPPTPTPTPTATPPPTSPTPTPTPPAGGSGTVRAAAETTPVHHGGDAADDPAIWIHPTDPGRSTIIGTDKLGGLAVYDLAGNELAYYADSTPNNVDLRYNFPLGGERVALVVTSDTATDSLRTYRIDPATRQLIPVAARTIDVGIGVAGLCAYVSPSTGQVLRLR